MSLPPTFTLGLARALTAGAWNADAIYSQALKCLGKRYRFLKPLVERIVSAFPGDTRPSSAALQAWLQADRQLERAYERREDTEAPLTASLWREDEVAFPAWLAAAGLPDIPTIGRLAQYLGISPGKLSWYADERRCSSRLNSAAAHHYSYRWVAKRSGGQRLIEAPKTILKHLQQQVLSGILDCVPPHDAAHAYCAGHSTRTYVAPHCDRYIVLKLDLQCFFAMITRAQVIALFRHIGYTEQVAHCLGRLCTSSVPDAVLAGEANVDSRQRVLYRRPHLPQGSPTSPALANLCVYGLDCRLTALASSAGASYTRYADDLLFSGDETFARGVQRFAKTAAAIIAEQGHRIGHRKTRTMRRGVRQHAVGLVLNSHANIDRRDYDQLKATLTNCLRHGPASQNREQHPHFREHLSSRVAYVMQINPQRGEKLQQLLKGITWE